MVMNKTTECRVIKVVGEKAYGADELVASEYFLTIFLNNKRLATLLCTPEKLKELTYGFLRTERLISSVDDIVYFNLDEEKGIAQVETVNKEVCRESFFSKKIDLEIIKNIKITKGSISGNFIDNLNCKPLNSDICLDINMVFDYMAKDLDYSEVFKTTRGIHSVALCDTAEVKITSEDVSRHNALDKVIGEALIKDINLKDKIVILSGRVSLEMVLKAAKLQIPIVISKSAPTSLAVALAKKLNITLVSNVKENKMNIYSSQDRIKIK